MSTGPADPAQAPRRVVRLTLLLALGLAPLAACSDDPPPSSGYSAEDDATQEIGRALRLRERAVLAQDQTTFLRTVVGDEFLVADQTTYFENLQELPVGLLRHRLDPTTLEPDGADGAPLWLTEGLAEYVSVRPMEPSDRQLPSSALSLVTGGVTDLPADEVFLGADAQAWYAVAWWICEFVAAEYGTATLWELLDELAHGADQAKVLDRVLGVTPAELARRGADPMVSTYGS